MKNKLILAAACLALSVISAYPAPVFAQCQLCAQSPNDMGDEALTHHLQVEVIQPLNFDRVALDSNMTSGSVTVAPEGGRSLSGQVVDLGGQPMSGKVRLRGAPGRGVRIDLPNAVTMIGPGGRTATLAQIHTSLPSSPRLGGDGTLEFSFGGQLMVTGSTIGEYRGRVPIDAYYE